MEVIIEYSFWIERDVLLDGRNIGTYYMVIQLNGLLNGVDNGGKDSK